MRTSNPGMRDFENLGLASGGKVYTEVGRRMADLAEHYPGEHGYGAFGVVVGCTEATEALEIRGAFKRLFFLIPGYGAQGGGAEVAAQLLCRGNGGVVNASRSLLTAWATADPGCATLEDAALAAREAALTMRFDLQKAALRLADDRCNGCDGIQCPR
jgi:orotidine-5'-phosphate decarboxylase